MPIWVRNYVIIHEMAHLIEPNHSKSFWNIVSRFKLTERARGYLMAKGLDREKLLQTS
ncbi:MAG: M48 family metallopeptidase [Candidatus Omnitrophica bacterium]|nr:M48 family metallopeptidase [Candidatus Omnitrophota bacterium]MBU4457674.1 M48 family metallopeptidase [Candidatus Omnitrophota bacterium]